MYLAIIIIPLLGSGISGLLGRFVGVIGSQFTTSTLVIITIILAVLGFFEVGFNSSPVSFLLWNWVESEMMNIDWSFSFDSLTSSMLIPVLIVSGVVHIFSISYMSTDPHTQRFFSYLSLFTFMMVLLVSSSNYLLMFVGWEGVGVCSYLLVNYWFTRIAANQSSMSAFLTNRVGDCFLTIGMFVIFWAFGTLDYATIYSLTSYMSVNVITLIGLCLLIGAMAKSSQFGLHVWLPMAMEGPTPVSALIHAATMVTAGVYLLMRSSCLIEYSDNVLLLCVWLGAVTCIFSSLIGLFQQDIKKVVAYSTMSQLGMMVVSVGLSLYNLALFHLMNHAFYKALLFLASGSVIHAVSDNQDFRKYGGLRQFLPLTYSVILIASLSLIAFPYMTGFYSKDLIIEAAYAQFDYSSYVIYFITAIAAGFTTLYSVKVIYLTFLSNPNGSKENYKSAHEGNIFMTSPLIILSVLSIYFGFLFKDVYVGLGSGFFIDNSLFTHPLHEILTNAEFAVPSSFKLLPLIFSISCIILAMSISEFYPKILMYFKYSRIGYTIFGFFNQRFLIEFFYNKYITGLILALGGHYSKKIDKGTVEYTGPWGLEMVLPFTSYIISNLVYKNITYFGLLILIGLINYVLIVYASLNTYILMTCTFSLFCIIKLYSMYIKTITSSFGFNFKNFLFFIRTLDIRWNIISPVKKVIFYISIVIIVKLSLYLYNIGLNLNSISLENLQYFADFVLHFLHMFVLYAGSNGELLEDGYLNTLFPNPSSLADDIKKGSISFMNPSNDDPQGSSTNNPSPGSSTNPNIPLAIGPPAGIVTGGAMIPMPGSSDPDSPTDHLNHIYGMNRNRQYTPFQEHEGSILGPRELKSSVHDIRLARKCLVQAILKYGPDFTMAQLEESTSRSDYLRFALVKDSILMSHTKTEGHTVAGWDTDHPTYDFYEELPVKDMLKVVERAEELSVSLADIRNLTMKPGWNTKLLPTPNFTRDGTPEGAEMDGDMDNRLGHSLRVQFNRDNNIWSSGSEASASGRSNTPSEVGSPAGSGGRSEFDFDHSHSDQSSRFGGSSSSSSGGSNAPSDIGSPIGGNNLGAFADPMDVSPVPDNNLSNPNYNNAPSPEYDYLPSPGDNNPSSPNDNNPPSPNDNNPPSPNDNNDSNKDSPHKSSIDESKPKRKFDDSDGPSGDDLGGSDKRSKVK